MAKAKDNGGLTRVRVLADIYLDGVKVPPDTVLDLTAEQLADHLPGGAVDPHPEAVAYAEQLAALAAAAEAEGKVLE